MNNSRINIVLFSLILYDSLFVCVLLKKKFDVRISEKNMENICLVINGRMSGKKLI